MSKFAARMAYGLTAIYDRLGDQAVFKNRAGLNTDCTVIVQRDLNEYGDTPGVNTDTVLIRVRRSEIAPRPLRDEVFTMVDSCDAYSVIKAMPSSDEYEHRLLAK